jgi:hypothetical protein
MADVSANPDPPYRSNLRREIPGPVPLLLIVSLLPHWPYSLTFRQLTISLTLIESMINTGWTKREKLAADLSSQRIQASVALAASDLGVGWIQSQRWIASRKISYA